MFNQMLLPLEHFQIGSVSLIVYYCLATELNYTSGLSAGKREIYEASFQLKMLKLSGSQDGDVYLFEGDS